MTAAYRAPLALLLLLAACGDDKEKAIFVPNTDTDRPTDRDSGSGSADTSIDSSTDPVDTTGDDTGSGADTDLADSGSGADTDLTDTTADTTPDTAADTTADTISDTTADTTADTAVDTTPDTAADTTVDTRPEPPVVWTPTETPVPPPGVGIKTFTCPQRDPTSTFFITEVQINPNNAEGRGTSTEWFEVIDMGATPFNLNGVRVADADTDQFTIGAPPPAGSFGGDAVCGTLAEVGAFFDVPTDTTIDPYEFFTFYQQTQIDAVCAADPSCKPYQGLHYYVFDRCFMAIGNNADEIILYDTRGRVLDCVEYTASAVVESQSLQRLYRGGTWTNDWCVTSQVESLRYNSNAEISTTPVPGDYGTPGQPPRCVE